MKTQIKFYKKTLFNLECPKCESNNLNIEDVVICPRIYCNNCKSRFVIKLKDLDTNKEYWF